jgi:hypothetical protein
MMKQKPGNMHLETLSLLALELLDPSSPPKHNSLGEFSFSSLLPLRQKIFDAGMSGLLLL